MKLQELFEAQNYGEMFAFLDTLIQDNVNATPKRDRPELTPIAALKTSCAGHIDWAETMLKRKDRVTWYLRWVKLAALYKIEAEKHLDLTAESIEKLNRQKNALKSKLPSMSNDDLARESAQFLNSGTIASWLEHILSLPVAAIQNFQFTNQTAGDIIQALTALENKWKEGAEGTVSGTDGKLFLKTIQNFAWYDLEAPYSKVEACAMGHCGNAPNSSDPNQTILSLRQKLPNGKYRVCLTFIFHKKEGMLGEMKGRGNDKPSAEYHSEIEDLIMDSRIKGIVGGGFAPESNFTIWDLGDKAAKELLEKKPTLCPVGEYIEHIGVDDFILGRMKEIFTMPYTIDGVFIVLPLGESISQLFKSRGKHPDNGIAWLIAVQEGDVLNDSDYAPSNREIAGAMSRELDATFLKRAEAKYGDTKDLDYTDVSDVIDYMEAHEPEDYDNLVDAGRRAIERSIEGEQYAFLDKLLKHEGIRANIGFTSSDITGREVSYDTADYTDIPEVTFAYESLSEAPGTTFSVKISELLKMMAILDSTFYRISHIGLFPAESDVYDGLLPRDGFTGWDTFDEEFESYMNESGLNEIFGKSE